jgi:NAD-dependent oxidoreductase involved in siderophore biosynthesis
MLAGLREKYQQTNLWRSTRVLSRNDQKKISAVILLQIIFSVLDLIGVALIGVIGALAIRGVSSQEPGDRVSSFRQPRISSSSCHSCNCGYLIVGS